MQIRLSLDCHSWITHSDLVSLPLNLALQGTLLVIPICCVSRSFCNCVFAMKEANSRSFERPWSNTRYLYLVESLALAFPQCVLHLILIAEDTQSLPSIKGTDECEYHVYRCSFYPMCIDIDLIFCFRPLSGYLSIAGLAILSCAITFARYRFDLQNRFDRFGGMVEKPIRFVYIWANKGNSKFNVNIANSFPKRVEYN
jgi:hypothetical protein